MNRTAIEWTDFTWGPVTGCWGPGGSAKHPKRCPYCYGVRLSRRFPINFNRFLPTFHPDRLSQPAEIKKPSKIFVCSMADLFGDWVPSEWINAVLGAAGRTPQHIYQFLTKNPKRLSQWNGLWPDNAWVGTTVTNQADADERLPWLLQVDAPVRFVSHEPLMGEINIGPWVDPTGYCCGGEQEFCHCLDGWPSDENGLVTLSGNRFWAIIGAMTGPGAVRPEPEWIASLIRQYRAAGVPIFIKDNLYPPGAPATVKFQEFPA